LFEIEVPEVYNGVVEIKAIAREAGFRSKVAVSATQPGIDPVGSCIGIRGNRIQSIVNELQGEKIDIVSWDEEPRTFITNALSPSEPVHVELLTPEQTAIVVVPDRQLSLAIGKEGQNTRLAARLTGWRLDIKGMTEWEEIKEATQAITGSAVAAEVAVVEAAEAVEEAIAIVEEAGAVVAEPAAEVAPVTAEAVPPEPEPAAEQDEDAILAALIQEEEQQAPAEAATAESLSVEDLGAFTIDDVELSDNDDEDEEEEEEDEGELPSLDDLPVLIPDAGKIRFAEDIVEEFRGGGRGGRRRRGSGGARGGSRGGARGGGAAAGGGR
jgi:transcription antitermination factor NusA-like protein